MTIWKLIAAGSFAVCFILSSTDAVAAERTIANFEELNTQISQEYAVAVLSHTKTKFDMQIDRDLTKLRQKARSAQN